MYSVETSYEDFLRNEQDKYPELNLKDIEELKKRVKANEDLPPIQDKLIVMFLHGCYFDVDVTYKTIVVHFKYRKELPEVFNNYDPLSEETRQVFEIATISVVTDYDSGKKERIIYTNFKNTDPSKFNYVEFVKYFFMMVEHLMVKSGTFDGLVIAMNTKGMSWRHIAKTPMGTMKKIIGFVQEGLPIRLKGVHVLNAGSIVTMVFNIVKPFIKSDLMEILKIYPENSPDVFNNLPYDLMPIEIGGSGKSHYELSEKTYNLMVSDRKWFLSLDKYTSQTKS